MVYNKWENLIKHLCLGSRSYKAKFERRIVSYAMHSDGLEILKEFIGNTSRGYYWYRRKSACRILKGKRL